VLSSLDQPRGLRSVLVGELSGCEGMRADNFKVLVPHRTSFHSLKTSVMAPPPKSSFFLHRDQWRGGEPCTLKYNLAEIKSFETPVDGPVLSSPGDSSRLQNHIRFAREVASSPRSSCTRCSASAGKGSKRSVRSLRTALAVRICIAAFPNSRSTRRSRCRKRIHEKAAAGLPPNLRRNSPPHRLFRGR